MAKFADISRPKPFELTPEEQGLLARIRNNLQPNNQKDAKGRAIPQCCKYLHVGVFFDGTNNNKYFDTPSLSHSNVARLYDVFPGEGVTKAATSSSRAVKMFNPKLGLEEDKMKHDNKTAADAVPLYSTHDQIKSNRQYFRKIYVPGVGTPFQAVGDDNSLGFAPVVHIDNNQSGEASGTWGDERIVWAIWQVINLLLETPIDAKKIKEYCHASARKNENQMLVYLRYLYKSHYQKAVSQRLPKTTKIRLYVFGFSRGATAARSFCQRMQNIFPENKIPTGNDKVFIEIEYVFLGIFDSVASVGTAHGAKVNLNDGHNSWASIPLMNPKVRKCVHLVAAHEVRGSFPITPATAICNVEEIVYPGVHSDLGGGYSPYEQGRSTMGNGDTGKLSQIPLADMYRKALLAGVPFLLQGEWDSNPTAKKVMQVDAQLIKDFNAYCNAAKSGNQPLAGLLRHHYDLYIRWLHLRQHDMMKVMESRLAQIKNDSNMRQRDRLDLRDSQRGLKYELDFLKRSEQAGKAILINSSVRTSPLLPIPTYYRRKKIDSTDTTQLPGERPAFFDSDAARMQKYKEWIGGIKTVWEKTPKLENSAIIKMFDDYVHDSRAWFRVETPESWGYLRRRFIIFKAAQVKAKCAAPAKNQTAQTAANKPNTANKQAVQQPKSGNHVPAKPLQRHKQALNREIKNEQAGLARAEAELNAARRNGASANEIRKREQNVQDWKLNIKALERERKNSL